MHDMRLDFKPPLEPLHLVVSHQLPKLRHHESVASLAKVEKHGGRASGTATRPIAAAATTAMSTSTAATAGGRVASTSIDAIWSGPSPCLPRARRVPG